MGADYSWEDEGACARKDMVADFFGDNHKAGYNRARKVCEGCPVRLACLSEALSHERTPDVLSRSRLQDGSGPRERSTGTYSPGAKPIRDVQGMWGGFLFTPGSADQSAAAREWLAEAVGTQQAVA